jgi:pilus assembly protein CpaC
MVNKKVLFILTACIILLFSSVAFAAIPVEVVEGKETVLTLKEPSKRVSIADPEVAGMILISPTEIVINGKKSGVTSLIVWDSEDNKTFFDVIVYKERLIEFEKEKIDDLETKIKIIAPEANVKAEFAGETLVLNGTAKNRQVLDKIEKFAMLYASKGCTGVSRSASLPRTSEESRAEAKEEELKPGGGFVSVNVQQQTMQQNQPPAEALCVLNLITIHEAQQVILEVRVAQIDKTKLKDLATDFVVRGIQNNAEITAPGLFTSPIGGVGGEPGLNVTPAIGGFDLSVVSPQIGVAHFPSGVAAVLKAIQEDGLGRILAQPNMVVRSGESGQFHVGKEIPVQMVYGIGTNAIPYIEFKEVGIRLNFAPEVLETGAIRLKIDPAEVSSIARYITTGGLFAPEIDTRKVQTSVDLREGESLILAGLLSDEMKESLQKVPILGDIPILGALFRYKHEELTNTELAFFITPKLVKPLAPGVKTELPTDNRPTPEEEKEFQWIPAP